MGNTVSKRKRLARLFEAYASNLSAFVPSLQNIFACPLCLGGFTQDTLESEGLTEEHIISRELGGKLITITCKECNSRGGAELDAHLVNEFRALDKISGLSDKPFRGRVKVGDVKQDVGIYVSSGKSPRIQLLGDKKRTNPASLREIEHSLETEPGNIKFQLNFGYDRHRANVAKLRAAYLLMFRYFGYEYILHKNVERVRQQILAPGQDVIASKASFAFGLAPEELNSIGLLRSPPELRCFVVSFRVSTAVDRSFGVVLPGLDDEGDEVYDRWHEKRETLKGMEMDVTIILQNPHAPPGYIYKGAVMSAWNTLR
jgi:hypothetical protein